MIKKLEWQILEVKSWDGEKVIDESIAQAPSNIDITEKINEIIDYLNEKERLGK